MEKYIEKIETQTLNFYAILVIILGIWMAFSPYTNLNFVRVINNIYSPLWILSTIYIIGATINILLRNKYFWIYVLFVSTPLVFFGLVFLQISLITNAFAPTVILSIFIGIYSAIRCGQIFQRRNVLNKINNAEKLT